MYIRIKIMRAKQQLEISTLLSLPGCPACEEYNSFQFLVIEKVVK